MGFKVSIIGGGGRVGSDAAYALQFGDAATEIALVDMNAEMAAGEALDLRHGASLLGNCRFLSSNEYGVVEGSDCVVITAGLRRKPDETRLDLINRNVGLFRGILDSLRGVRLAEGATILVVSNPVDILTRLAAESGLVPIARVLGLGTVLDTARFRSLLADELGLSALDVKALVLGEHGDTMVPILSSATIGGVPLTSMPGITEARLAEVFDKTKKSGAEVIRLKGGAGRAVGASIKEVVESIAGDERRLLPVSSVQTGALGVTQVAFSLPTEVGREGVVRVVEPRLNEAEAEGLRKSAESLGSTYAQLG